MVLQGIQDSQIMDIALRCGSTWTCEQIRHVTALASRLGFIAVHLPSGLDSDTQQRLVEELVNSGCDLMIVTDSLDLAPNVVHGFDLVKVKALRERLDAVGDTSPLIVDLALAIGRTRNEAVARASLEPSFSGPEHPENSGIFGTFEEGQIQVMELARAGAEVLLLSLPLCEDMADLLAQVRALVVGPSVNLVAGH